MLVTPYTATRFVYSTDFVTSDVRLPSPLYDLYTFVYLPCSIKFTTPLYLVPIHWFSLTLYS